MKAPDPLFPLPDPAAGSAQAMGGERSYLHDTGVSHAVTGSSGTRYHGEGRQ